MFVQRGEGVDGGGQGWWRDGPGLRCWVGHDSFCHLMDGGALVGLLKGCLWSVSLTSLPPCPSPYAPGHPRS